MPVNKQYFSDLMKDRKLSLREVAKRIDVWPGALSRSFDNKRTLRMEEAVALAQVLAVPLAELLVNAGIEQAITAGRRCNIIGHGVMDAVVEPLPADAIERIAIPDGLPDDVVAIQVHTSETPDGFSDGWVTFLAPEADAADCLGTFSLVAIEGGGWMMGTIRRGYSPGTYNIFSPMRQQTKNVRIQWARRAIMTVH